MLTQLAKTRRVLLVEGKDFQVLGKFARKLGEIDVALRRDFAVVPVDGFNPDRIRYLKSGMEKTLGGKIIATAVLDRDYCSDDECEAIASSCKDFCKNIVIHKRKEIENFLLVPNAIDRAFRRGLADRARRSGARNIYEPCAAAILNAFADSKKTFVASEYISQRRNFERKRGAQLSEASMSKLALDEFEKQWASAGAPFELIPGKEAQAGPRQDWK